MSLNRAFAGAFGAVYTLVGLIGFAVTSGVEFAANDGGRILGIFEVNPLHNVVHLAIGALLLIGAARGHSAARTVNMTIGIAYLATGILGLFLVGNEEANFLALNNADNALHFGTAILALGVATMADRAYSTQTSTTRRRNVA